jgi:hypothetical protein
VLLPPPQIFRGGVRALTPAILEVAMAAERASFARVEASPMARERRGKKEERPALRRVLYVAVVVSKNHAMSRVAQLTARHTP